MFQHKTTSDETIMHLESIHLEPSISQPGPIADYATCAYFLVCCISLKTLMQGEQFRKISKLSSASGGGGAESEMSLLGSYQRLEKPLPLHCRLLDTYVSGRRCMMICVEQLGQCIMATLYTSFARRVLWLCSNHKIPTQSYPCRGPTA